MVLIMWKDSKIQQPATSACITSSMYMCSKVALSCISAEYSEWNKEVVCTEVVNAQSHPALSQTTSCALHSL